MQHLQPNTTLQGGKYRIERVLGQGGFGITYLAKYTSNGRKVAIKELFVSPRGQAINSRKGNEVVVTNFSNQEQFEKHKTKFKKEAERLATYHHQNIVKVSECFEENGTVYYVMTFIEGESLRSKLNREGALPEELVLNYLCQLLDALSVIHRDKIWHLDLKPDNIMVDKDDHIYLIDFGASKHIVQGGTLTTSSMMAFTPGYYPPEQISSNMRNIGAWTDIYALGATIYNLLTKKAPPSFDSLFSEGKNAFSFTSKVLSETRDLIIKMMNPNRKNRLQSVFEVRDEMEKGKKKEEEVKRQQEVTIVERPRKPFTPDNSYYEELRLKADSGNKAAQVNLGHHYKDEGNYQMAVYYYRMAAESGSRYGQKHLGICYENGIGVPKDLYEALKWYTKAANQGWEEAIKNKMRLEQIIQQNQVYESKVIPNTSKDVDFWDDCLWPGAYITMGILFAYCILALFFDWPYPEWESVVFWMIYGIVTLVIAGGIYIHEKDN